MKTLDDKILINLLTELNMCRAKHSALKASNLPTSRINDRMELLESRIAAQKAKIDESRND